MHAPTTFACAFLIAVTPLLTACGGSNSDFIQPGEETAALAMWIWLAADEDTFVSSSAPSTNYGLDSELHVTDAASGTSRSYVRFTMPDLPAGSVVEEAYLELQQSGTTTGTYGQELLSFVPVEQPWAPQTMTYNSQPLTFPGVNEFDLTPSQNGSGWWTSPNLKRYADYKLANPNLNYGFGVSRAPDNLLLYTFRSNNDGSRTPTTIGNGPRFVMKVTMPYGVSLNDITMPPLPPGHDLQTNAQGQAARALLHAGDTPPASWNVGAGQ